MKKWLFFFTCLLLLSTIATAQVPKRQKIALFAPLYLDSVFNGSSYRYGKEFPKFLNSGLEFYQGAQLALDSLQKMGAPLEVFVYDTRSKRTSIPDVMNNAAMADVELIVAHATNAEVRQLADIALRKKVPLISATLPNDAGVTANPYLVVLNSTLRAHCEAIYRYLQTAHPRDKIVYFKKSGPQEGLLNSYFNDMMQSATGTKLKWETIDASSTFDVDAFAARLDSTSRTVCIAGSLDQNWGGNLATELAAISETYPITLIGMPTWDGIREFAQPEYKSLELVYSTPFYYARNNRLEARLAADFEERIESRPTDMFFRGYETMLRFALLLLETKKDVASNLTKKGNYVFTQFNIEPVFLNKQAMTLDYFENKKLYFIRRYNGKVEPVRTQF